VDSTSIIRIISGGVFIGVLAIAILISIFYILTLSRALNKCAPASRTIETGTLWLLLVPLVNLVWHFFVVLGMAKSLANEFRARNTPAVDPEPGKTLGIAMCVCGAASIIPLVGLITGLVYFVLWIIYWSKIAEFSRKLDQVPAVLGTSTSY
jgi:hypothetical protein